MPCRTERTLGAIGIKGDNVYRRNLGFLVKRHMVVGNHSAVAFRKETTITCGTCSTPYLLNNVGGKGFRHAFAIELSPNATHQIQQYSVTRFVTSRQVCGEMLRAKRPSIFAIFLSAPFWRAPIFGIKAHKVYTNV